MKENLLKPDMKVLRPTLGEVVSILETKAPYGAVILSSLETTRHHFQ